MKTYIVLPFKDRKGKYQRALDNFINPFMSYLSNNLKNEYHVFIVEQAGKTDLFNLAKTINIGFDLFQSEMNPDDIFIFHPVDLLPLETDYNIQCTTKFCYTVHSPSGEFYKSIGFLCSDFRKINGFSNMYWGWGCDDDDMFVRLQANNIKVETKINNYVLLEPDGNTIGDEPLYSPRRGYNMSLVGQMRAHRNHMVSGLHDLKYKVIEKTMYKGIEKYIVDSGEPE